MNETSQITQAYDEAEKKNKKDRIARRNAILKILLENRSAIQQMRIVEPVKS